MSTDRPASATSQPALAVLKQDGDVSPSVASPAISPSLKTHILPCILKRESASSVNTNSTATVAIGDPSLEVYVRECDLSSIKNKEPKYFCTKLMELLFSRQEAKTSSMKGGEKGPDGEPLKKLDEKKLMALKSQGIKAFPGKQIDWEDILKAIDNKCHYRVQNSCLSPADFGP